jgi:hypothetical protein
MSTHLLLPALLLDHGLIQPDERQYGVVEGLLRAPLISCGSCDILHNAGEEVGAGD